MIGLTQFKFSTSNLMKIPPECRPLFPNHNPPSLASFQNNTEIDQNLLEKLICEYNKAFSRTPKEILSGKEITLKHQSNRKHLNINSFKDLTESLVQHQQSRVLDETFKCNSNPTVFTIAFVFPEDTVEMLKLCGALAAFKMKNPNNVYLMQGDLPDTFFSDPLIKSFYNTLVNRCNNASAHPNASFRLAKSLFKPTSILLLILTIVRIISLKPHKIIGKYLKTLKNGDRAHTPI